MTLFLLLSTSCVLGMSLRLSPVFSLILALPALACAMVVIEVIAVISGHDGMAWYYLPLAVIVMEGAYVAASLLTGPSVRRVA